MMKIGGCRACETCFKTGKACSFDDDFNTIAPAILEADAIVFTMPVYWYSIPAQIKGVIDRIYSLVVGGKDIAGKECALIACCEEEDLTVLDGVRIPMERTAALNKWKMVGEVLVPGVLKPGDIEKTEGRRSGRKSLRIVQSCGWPIIWSQPHDFCSKRTLTMPPYIRASDVAALKMGTWRRGAKTTNPDRERPPR